MSRLWGRIVHAAKRVRGMFHFSSVAQPLALFSLLISLLPLALSTVVIYNATHRLLEEELVKSYSLLQRQYAAGIEYKLRLHDDSLMRLAGSSVVQQILYDTQAGLNENPYIAGTQISKEVGNFLRSGTVNEVSNCMVYAESGRHTIYGNRVAPATAAERTSWYTDYLNREGNHFFVSGSSPLFAIVQDIYYVDEVQLTAKRVGFVKLDLDVRLLFDPLDGEGYDEYRYSVVIMSGGSVVYADLEGPVPELLGEQGEAGVFRMDNYIVTTAALAGYDLEMFLLFEVGQTDAKLNELVTGWVPYMLPVVLSIVVFTILYTRRLRCRISLLTDKMEKVESGDLAITETMKGHDELYALDQSFNKMVDQLDRLIKKNYVQELEKRDAQFRNLQLQINPHFLYNTLETVASIAAVHEVHQISELASRLGEIFRYSLGRKAGSHATLRQELTHTKNYVYIQKARFGDKIEVLYDVDETLMDLRIMRFILQPLVENAIIHGFGEVKSGTVEIAVACEGDDALILSVEDDGVGMPPDQVERLRRYIDKPDAEGDDSGGIGVRNVHQRVQMAYGKGYGVKIMAAEGQGSCFSVILPLQ